MSMKDAAQTFAACFAATLVLTACGREETRTEAATAPLPAARTPQLRWVEIPAVEGGESGSALSLLGEGDRQMMHLACRGAPGRIEVIGRNFQLLSGEDRLTLGVDDQAFALVANPEAPAPGVTAAGALEPALIGALEHSREIGLIYAGQRVGPFEAPDAEVLTRFAAMCRGLAGSAPDDAAV